ncbi:hypothetical protein CANARDRAFT_28144 [[Candida] arabinofermentans NRRL YB-2248]|uniref:GTPase-activating protein GYP7 n=1 Tax=[Candida] arabinofermentans NRRL YB-2248 TaxID=983967 RepID=A0A1E4T2Y1_9ASCO|nr:hypothetical protein CANARDRAFT_28144 [[Candida] arabinofermentans NRRL YB-2248]
MSASSTYPPGKGQLLFTKSKVYIHVSSSKKDNVPGYLTIVRPFKDSTNRDLIVAFIPEADISADDKESLDFFDLYGLDGETFNFYGSSSLSSTSLSKQNKDSVQPQLPKVERFIDRPRLSSLASYAFGITISNLFSLQVRPKASNLWYGSILLYPRDSFEKMPALFFHDDECPGTKREQDLKSKKFDPFASNGVSQMYWGGDRFISVLKSYCVLENSPLEKGMILVNPSKEDMINFIPNVIDNPADVDPFKDVGQSVNQFFNNTKWKVLSSLATVSKFAKNSVEQVLVNDKVPQPIKNILKKPEVKVIGDEFDSANIYLAKWALAVQQEAEKSRKLIIGNSYYKDLISTELGDNFVELTPLEVSRAARLKPVSQIEWDLFFDHTKRLQVTVDEVKDRVFHGGLEESVRKEAWLFLLGVYPWDTSKEERKQLSETLLRNYEEYKQNWQLDLEHQRNTEYWKDQKVRIDKDVKRTDRELDIYKPEDDELDQDDSDDAEIKNKNLLVLRDILFSFNELNTNLGYVQGMTDLLSPLYYVFRDEALTFWSFTNFMEIMERNFVKDLSGMKLQMLTLNELVQFLLPKLYIHLEKCDSNNLFFFFRMLLVWFKRELSFDETMKLWEILWTNYYSSQFILFFALAILEKHSSIIMNNLHQFDQILKYMNDLGGNLDLEDLLIRAELLFLKFRQMVELIDRKNDSVGSGSLNRTGEKIPISDELRKLLSKETIIQKEEERTADTPFG